PKASSATQAKGPASRANHQRGSAAATRGEVLSAAYVDASALVKLVVPEAESVALAAELSTWDEWISAAITITEVTRAAARWAAASKLSSSDSETLMSQVKAVTSRLTLMDVDLALLQQAAAIPPVELRSLDAIHL